MPNKKKRVPSMLLNEKINMNPLKHAIVKQFGSVYEYCRKMKCHESDTGRILNKKKPLTLKILDRHAQMVGLTVVVKFVKK